MGIFLVEPIQTALWANALGFYKDVRSLASLPSIGTGLAGSNHTLN